MDAPQQRRSLEFPSPLLEELGASLTHYVERRTEPELDEVRHALGQLCDNAHRRGMGPERMVIAVKEAWAAVPETHQRQNPREVEAIRGLFDRVLQACLDLYFAKRDVEAN